MTLPIVPISHLPQCRFSLKCLMTSNALALVCTLELQPLKRKIFNGVSTTNADLWSREVRENGTCKQHWKYHCLVVLRPQTVKCAGKSIRWHFLLLWHELHALLRTETLWSGHIRPQIFSSVKRSYLAPGWCMAWSMTRTCQILRLAFPCTGQLGSPVPHPTQRPCRKPSCSVPRVTTMQSTQINPWAKGFANQELKRGIIS
jgi:hypothetical protein